MAWQFVVTAVLFSLSLFDLGLWSQMLAEGCNPTEKAFQDCVWCSLWCSSPKTANTDASSQTPSSNRPIQERNYGLSLWQPVFLNTLIGYIVLQLQSATRYTQEVSYIYSTTNNLFIVLHRLAFTFKFWIFWITNLLPLFRWLRCRLVAVPIALRPPWSFPTSVKVRRCEWISSVCAQGRICTKDCCGGWDGPNIAFYHQSAVIKKRRGSQRRQEE